VVRRESRLGTRTSPSASPQTQRFSARAWINHCWRCRRCRPVSVALVSLVLVAAWPAGAKQKKPVTRTIAGAVLDQAENGIGGASVELTDLQTGKKIAIYTEQGGRYQFSDLKFNDDYQVQATYKNQPSDLRKVSGLIQEAKVVVNLHIPPPKSE